MKDSKPNNTKSVRDLPLTGVRYDQRTGTKGLVVRVTPTGTRQYRWTYTHPTKMTKGKSKRAVLVIGDANTLGFGAACDALEAAKARVAIGLPPITEAAQSASDAAGTPVTVQELAEQFYTQRILTIRDRPETAYQMIHVNIIPAIGKVKLSQLTQDHLLVPSDMLVARGCNAHAKTVFKLTNQMMKWAVARKKHTDNPMADLSLVDAGIPDNACPRDRVLDDHEIAAFFTEVDRACRCDIKIATYKLLLLTGCRTREIRENAWVNVDLDAAVMTVPVALLKSRKKTKGLKDMKVPLSDTAVSILRRLKRITGHTPFITGNPITGEPMGPRLLYNTIVQRAESAKLEHFSVHDLRRTCRTLLSRLNTPYEVAEAYVGHALPLIVRTYSTGDLFEKRAAAAKVLSDHVSPLMGEGMRSMQGALTG